MPIDLNRDRAWYESKLFTKSIIYGFSLLVLVKFSHSVFFKQNDFDWHLGYGYPSSRRLIFLTLKHFVLSFSTILRVECSKNIRPKCFPA